MKSVPILFSLFFTSSVHSWGYFGHELIGDIAEPMLTPKAKSTLSDLLPNCGKGCLRRVSPWADKIKNKPQYRFSKGLHYINTGDNPPQTCSKESSFDCAPGKPCVLQAILNYTERVSDSTLPIRDRQDALRFLVHYIEDIHQPLHLSGKQRGGTQEKVKWQGRRSSLHRVWDSQLISKRIKEDFTGSRVKYINHIRRQLNTTWSTQSLEWLSCTKKEAGSLCPNEWGIAINRLNCDFVWVYAKNEDLSKEYYLHAKEAQLPDVLLGMAGVRLATILNTIFEDGAKLLVNRPNSPSSRLYLQQDVEKSYVDSQDLPIDRYFGP